MSVVITRSHVRSFDTRVGVPAELSLVPPALSQFTFWLPRVMVEINWLAARFSLPR